MQRQGAAATGPGPPLPCSGLAQRGTVSLQKEGIEIRGFNSFKVKFYNGYKGRNPKTGDPIKVDGKKLPFFKVGKELRERVDR